MCRISTYPLGYYSEVPTLITHRQKLLFTVWEARCLKWGCQNSRVLVRVLLLGRCLPCQMWWEREQRNSSLMTFIRALIILSFFQGPYIPVPSRWELKIFWPLHLQFLIYMNMHVFMHMNIYTHSGTKLLFTYTHAHTFVHIYSWFWTSASFYPDTLLLVFLVYVHIHLTVASPTDLLTPQIQKCVTHTLVILWQP